MSPSQAERAEGARPGFIWFSQRVDEALALAGEAGLHEAVKLIDEAAAQKAFGYGPPQSDITAARRKWLAKFSDIYDPKSPKEPDL